jgi:hypothetical protein
MLTAEEMETAHQNGIDICIVGALWRFHLRRISVSRKSTILQAV